MARQVNGLGLKPVGHVMSSPVVNCVLYLDELLAEQGNGATSMRCAGASTIIEATDERCMPQDFWVHGTEKNDVTRGQIAEDIVGHCQ